MQTEWLIWCRYVPYWKKSLWCYDKASLVWPGIAKIVSLCLLETLLQELCLKCKKWHSNYSYCVSWPRKKKAHWHDSHANMPVIYIQANIAMTSVPLCLLIYLSNAPSYIKWFWPLLSGISTAVTHTVTTVNPAKQSLLLSLNSPWRSSMMCRFVSCASKAGVSTLTVQWSKRLCQGYWGERQRGRTVWERCCSEGRAGLPGWQAASAVFLSVGIREAKK